MTNVFETALYLLRIAGKTANARHSSCDQMPSMPDLQALHRSNNVPMVIQATLVASGRARFLFARNYDIPRHKVISVIQFATVFCEHLPRQLITLMESLYCERASCTTNVGGTEA